MAINNLSQRVSELSQRLEELRIKCVSDPANAPEVLSDALGSIQSSLEELSAVDEELMKQNDELMRAQSNLQESDKQLQSVLAGMTDAYYFYDREWRVVDINPRAVEYFGRPREELIGHNVWELYPHTVGGKPWTEYHRAMAEGVPVHFETQSGASPRFFEVHAYPGPKGLAVYLRDITERKKMEAELEQLASFPKINPNPITEVDLEGRVPFLNLAAEKLFPNLKESGCNHPWLTDWEQVTRIFRKSGTSTFVRDLLIDNSWYQQSMYLVPNTQAIRIYGLDITERKRIEGALQEKQEELEVQAEELDAQNEELRANNEELSDTTRKLQESEARFRATFEQAAVGIEMLNLDGRFLRGNTMLGEILGYSQKELQNLNFADITYSDDLVRELPLLEDLLARRIGHYTIEKRYLRKDGLIVWVRVTSSLANVSEPYRISIIEDITGRKNVEEALRTSDARLNKAIETVREGVIIATEAEDVIYWNPAAQALHGFTRPSEGIEPLSDTPKTFDLIYPDTGLVLPLEDWPMKRIKRGEKVSNLELRLRRSDQGWVKYVSYSGTMVETSSGEHLIFLTVYDLTERKRMVEELRKSRDELELRVQERTAELSEAKENLEVINEELQVEISEHEKTEKDLMAAKEAAEAAIEAKAAFLANMSHELRTPLNAVIGFSSLLLEDSLTQDQKEYIERIRNGGEALLSIISDILEFSRAEKEKIKLELQPLSLNHCIEESLGMVAVQANDKGLNLAYTIGYGTPDIIITDHGRLRQILVNLLSNAVKFTDEGDISISVSSKVIEGNKRQITFEVMDTGIGMPQDKMDRLFQPFSQLEYVISRKRDGAGLGLAICKQLAELMGGEIRAESEESKGSTFRFTIPAETIPGKQLDLGKKDRVEYENLSGQKPLSILVAEDNPSNQRVLVEMLKRLGYRADAVADGVEVLQALQIRPYDLIFMDIRMPEMDGLTATKEIRKLWPDNGPKIIAITAFAMDGDREKCIEAGMDGYIAKPVKVDDLATLLRNITPPPQE